MKSLEPKVMDKKGIQNGIVQKDSKAMTYDLYALYNSC